MKRLSIKIFGRVQGVGFRFEILEKARQLGIEVDPRNEPNGSVSVRASGKAQALDDFVAWCHVGPPGAKVERVEVEKLSD
jgi:acylphosphatase